ncbi:MAG TPA: glycosyltransferase [Candidatus Saccharimonadales bacterium]|jgi:glycosyltransferase involved in cell wall biosynthesis
MTEARMKTASKTTKKLAKAPRKVARRIAGSAISPKSSVDLQSLKVAIVCDWLTGTGGAERVVLEMHKLFPKAPIYTSQYDSNPAIWYGDTWFQKADVRTTALQRLPKRLKKFLPVLRARTFSRLDLSAYDLVIASSGAEAKGVKVGPDTKLVWYCHAPTHYYWGRYEDYLKHPGFGGFDPLARTGLYALVKPLRTWDYAAAQRPDLIIANSTHTASEVKKYYDRDAKVVFPPVDIDRFGAQSSRKARIEPRAERFGFIIAGRQTPYKKIALAVEACSQLNLPLTVIGNGPEHHNLTALAGPSVRFLSKVSDAEMARHFKLAKAFLFPGIDDFGIVAVEALSAGTPVIAYRGGGALDYIKEGVTGEFFDEQTAESLAAALRSFDASKYDSSQIMKESKRYSTAQFGRNLTKALQACMKQTKK